MEEKAADIAELLKVLANKYRLLILCHLAKSSMSVGQLFDCLGGAITQPALSQHLSVLKSRNIVRADKSGQTVVYSIYDERVKDILHLLKDKYC